MQSVGLLIVGLLVCLHLLLSCGKHSIYDQFFFNSSTSNCGKQFCEAHASKIIEIPWIGLFAPVTVCNNCYYPLLRRLTDTRIASRSSRFRDQNDRPVLAQTHFLLPTGTAKAQIPRLFALKNQDREFWFLADNVDSRRLWIQALQPLVKREEKRNYSNNNNTHTNSIAASKSGLVSPRSSRALSDPSRAPQTPVGDWTVDDVAQWLDSLSLSEAISQFRSQLINGPMLFELTDLDLKHVIGIKNHLHRRKILRKIEQLTSGHVRDNPSFVRPPSLEVNGGQEHEPEFSLEQIDLMSPRSRASALALSRKSTSGRPGPDGSNQTPQRSQQPSSPHAQQSQPKLTHALSSEPNYNMQSPRGRMEAMHSSGSPVSSTISTPSTGSDLPSPRSQLSTQQIAPRSPLGSALSPTDQKALVYPSNKLVTWHSFIQINQLHLSSSEISLFALVIVCALKFSN